MAEPVNEPLPLDALDKRIINTLQTGFPLCERPYEQVAQTLGTDEQELIARLQALLERGVLSRFGPLYQAERLGGALTLCAMSIDEDDFERVADKVNTHTEVAHNYARGRDKVCFSLGHHVANPAAIRNPGDRSNAHRLSLRSHEQRVYG